MIAALGGILALPFFAESAGNGSPDPLLVAPAASVKRGGDVKFEDLHPFTHLALIPAASDPKRIRFKSVKATRVFTEVKFTMYPSYCKDLQFRDPGGSAYCPSAHDGSPAPAYEVTYSFNGEPMGSDEYGNRYFTFQVYFHPEELSPALRSALSAGKMHREALATYFKLAFSRQPVRETRIDEANSRFCPGHYVDGNWVNRRDPKCQDKVRFKTVTTLSDYITVRVDPISPVVSASKR